MELDQQHPQLLCFLLFLFSDVSWQEMGQTTWSAPLEDLGKGRRSLVKPVLDS